MGAGKLPWRWEEDGYTVNVSRLLDMGLVGDTGFGADIKCTLCKIYKVKEGEM